MGYYSIVISPHLKIYRLLKL